MRRKINENSERIFCLEKQVDDLSATLKAKRKHTEKKAEEGRSNRGTEGRASGSSSRAGLYGDPF